MHGVGRWASALAAVMLTVVGVGMPQAGATSSTDFGPSAVTAAGTFYPTDVQRLLGTSSAGYAVSAGRDVTVPVVGHERLPAGGVSAAMVNVTATAGAAAATLTVFPTGTPAPETSLLSVPANATRSALLTVPIGALGAFDVRDTGGPAAVSIDIVGFYAADDTIVASRGLGGGYQPTEPARLFDSRLAGPPDTGRAKGAIPSGASTLVRIDLGDGINEHVTALALQVSAIGPTTDGSVTVWGAGKVPDLASVSFSAGASGANLAVVPTKTEPRGTLDVSITNRAAAPVDVSVDLVGFYDDGGLGPNMRFRPLVPTRIVDSRLRQGIPALSAGTTATVAAPKSVAGDNTFGLVGVLTAVAPSLPSELRVWPNGADRPESPSVAVAAGATTSVPLQTEVGPLNTLDMDNAVGSTNVVLDVTGSFEAYPAVTDPSTKGWVHAVSGWQVSSVAR